MNTRYIKNIGIAALMLIAQGTAVFAQKDAKAREILEGMTAAYDKLGGVDITFGGSVNGKISLKGNMFKLDCDGVQTWFDGVTQWSYIKENNEVNISSPTPEELTMVNPYSLVRIYQNGFNYKYIGTKQFQGETCNEILLTPETQQNFESIRVLINPKMEPVNIEFAYSDEDKEVITVKRYKTNDSLTEDSFRFDMDAHSDAEIIDLR